MASADLPDRDQTTLADIVRAAQLASEFIEGLDREGFLDDRKSQAAVLHQIMLIGEGVRRLSDDLRAAHATIPWCLIAGMCDRLIHQYDAVDLEEVWKTVTTDIPALLRDLEALQSGSGQSPPSHGRMEQ